MLRLTIQALALLIAAGSAAAQDRGTLEPKVLPPIANPNDPNTPAKELFGRKPKPAPLEARAIGYYTSGCLAGGIMLPINGKNWQVMRLSRNRNWGHPNLIGFLERLAEKAPKAGWQGLLVGDLAQPRGGPMLTGHWSHQVGLDADLWLTQMPDRELTPLEREEMMATNVVAADWKDINPKTWTPAHHAIIKTAATEKDVERVLVNPAIKKALCREATGDRTWLSKVRPVVGHNYHFHIRIGCPAGQEGCKPQPPTPEDQGCGADLEAWFKKPTAPPVVGPARAPLKMSALPAACRQVLLAE